MLKRREKKGDRGSERVTLIQIDSEENFGTAKKESWKRKLRNLGSN